MTVLNSLVPFITSNLISFGNEDDQFDWTEGWNGTKYKLV
jgi:hypothetical protein